MNKLLKNPTYVNKQGYNGCDLGQMTDFSSTVGHILPVSWDFLQPGDKVNLRSYLKTRTTPLASAAMATIEENVRFFFVPMSQIYKPFEQLQFGIQDYGSDFYASILANGPMSDMLPACTINQFMTVLEEWSGLDDPQTADIPKFLNAIRLLEHIGLPMQSLLDASVNGATATVGTHKFSLFPLLAYHKIFFDYFRDTDRIANDPTYYNMDSYLGASGTDPSLTLLKKLLTLHTCPVQKDALNNIQVSPVFGETGIGGDSLVSLSRVNQWLSGLTTIANISPNGTTPQGDTSTPTAIAASQYLGNYAINTANLRSIFAAEKLLEITRRAHKHYDAQVLAHFGVDVPTGVDGECFEIGHHKQSIIIGDVVSTAASVDSDGVDQPLGEIAGKGYSAETSPNFSFEAKTSGVLMCVYYARPKYMYYQTGMDKKLMYVRMSDFPRPEYENLGQQPVFRMNQAIESDSTRNAQIQGWQWRYSEVKIGFDRVITGLARTLNNWVISKVPLYGTAPENFYVRPDAINTIMEVPYDDKHLQNDGTGDIYQNMDTENRKLFDTDPLLHQFALDYRKASKISTYGIQKL